MSKNDYIKRALKGDNSYHEIMTYFAHNDLINRGAKDPDNTGEIELTKKHYEKWRGYNIHMNIGQMWVFYAVECGHFETRQAQTIWRYGQVLNAIKRDSKDLLDPMPFYTCFVSIIKNPALYVEIDSTGQHLVDHEAVTMKFWEMGMMRIRDYLWLRPDDTEITGDELNAITNYRILAMALVSWIYHGKKYIPYSWQDEVKRFLGNRK